MQVTNSLRTIINVPQGSNSTKGTAKAHQTQNEEPIGRDIRNSFPFDSASCPCRNGCQYRSDKQK